jgi:hypothetical protein
MDFMTTVSSAEKISLEAGTLTDKLKTPDESGVSF